MELVKMAVSVERDGSSLGHLVQDLRLLLSSNRILSISKIPRLCNNASHELARYGMLDKRTQVWLDSVPDVLRNRIERDCNVTMV